MVHSFDPRRAPSCKTFQGYTVPDLQRGRVVRWRQYTISISRNPIHRAALCTCISKEARERLKSFDIICKKKSDHFLLSPCDLLTTEPSTLWPVDQCPSRPSHRSSPCQSTVQPSDHSCRPPPSVGWLHVALTTSRVTRPRAASQVAARLFYARRWVSV